MSNITTIWDYICNLERGTTEVQLRSHLMHQDALADTFRVAVCQDGKNVTLTGMSVHGYFYDYETNQTLHLDGSVNGNYASVTLPSECYDSPKWASLVIQVHDGDVKHSLLKADFYICRTGSEELYFPENSPTLADLISRIEALERGGGGGGNVTPGKDGGYYTPSVSQTNSTTMRIAFAPSQGDMPSVAAADITLPAGANGKTPVKGTDYVDGKDGVGIKSVLQTTTSSADGGSNVITVTKTDNTTSTFTVKNGSKGSAGKTPVKGTDYWTSDDKADIVSDILAILDASAAAHVVVDADKNITLSGDLANGVYTLKYENADGSVTRICELTISNGTGEPDLPDEPDVPPAPTYTNLVPTAKTHTNLSTVFNGIGYQNGKYASSSSPYIGDDSATVCTGVIPVTDNYVFYIKGITLDASANTHCRVGIGQAHATSGGATFSAVKQVNQMSDFATLETLDTQYYKLTISAAYVSANTTRQPYFFLSGIGTGANLIITANEPIV